MSSAVALTEQTPAWKSRIVGFEPAVDPEQLLANPSNWRIHPRAQRAALEGVLDEIGFVGAAMVNVQTGHLVDGHMRAESAMSKGAPIPVLYIDVSPEEEATILASFDPIGDLAKQDDPKLKELLDGMKDTHGRVHELLTDAVDFGAQALGDTSGQSDGSLLKLVEVTIGAPQHAVSPGDIWQIGPHLLAVFDVVGVPAWLDTLNDFQRTHGESVLFCPYPGPLLTITRRATAHRLFLVQPSPYIAGHILDRSAEIYGGDTITRLVAGSVDPSDADIEPEPPPGIGRTAARPIKPKRVRK